MTGEEEEADGKCGQDQPDDDGDGAGAQTTAALIARLLGEEQFAQGRHRKRVCLKHLVINRRSESWRTEWVGLNGGRRIKVQLSGAGGPAVGIGGLGVAGIGAGGWNLG